MVISLSVLSFLLHRIRKDVSLTFLSCLWSGCTMMPAANTADAEACVSYCLFSKDSRHWFGLIISHTKPNIPFATMLITSSSFTPNLKTKGVPGTPGHREDIHPAHKLSPGTSVIHSPIPHGHSTHEDVQKEKMSNYSQVVQRRVLYKLIKKWQSFLPLL